MNDAGMRINHGEENNWGKKQPCKYFCLILAKSIKISHLLVESAVVVLVK
jgi:hypothetical protein